MLINPYYLGVLFVFLFAVACFGFFKLYQQVRGEDEYEKMMERADAIIENARQEGKKIVEEANAQAYAIKEKSLQEGRQLDEVIASKQDKVNELEHEIKVLTDEDYLAIGGMRQDSVLDEISDAELARQIDVLRQRERDIITVKNAVSVQDPSLDYKFVDNNVKQILRAFAMECENIMLKIDDKTLEHVKSEIKKSFDILNQLFSTDSVQLSNDLLEIKTTQAELVYANHVRKKAEIAQSMEQRDSAPLDDFNPDMLELEHDDSDKISF